MKKLIYLTFCFIFCSGAIFGQIDNEFWFAAPDVTGGHHCGANPPGHGRPISIYITAEQATSVRIEMPGNDLFVPVDIPYLAAGDCHKEIITPTYLPDVFENYPMRYPPDVGQSIQKKAFHITSDPGNITVYYEMDNDCNRDIFALKGKNALGTDFYISTQNYFNNGPYTPSPYSGFVIVATEDNTTINIRRNGFWFYFTDPFPATETIVLNRGETFSFVSNSQTAGNHIMGVRVTSDKKISITWYDDSIAKGTCRDIAGDQAIPQNLIGKNYIVMKGDVASSNGGERIFVTATRDNTEVRVDGVLLTTLNTGQSWNKAISNKYELVECSEPVYINHISGTGGGCELGGATLPTIDGCTGSHNVTFTRGNNTSDPLRLNLMVRNETDPASPFKNKSIEHFTLEINGNVYPLSPSYFYFLPDSSWALLDWSLIAVQTFFTGAGKITPGVTATIHNPIARFHLGVQNGGAGNGGKYGYFSDYASNRGSAGIGGPKGNPKKTYCNLDPILFAVEGGVAYKWFSLPPNLGDTIYLNNTTDPEIYLTPPSDGLFKYGVIIYRECYDDTIVYLQARVVLGPIADFTVSNQVGCSPYAPIFTNNTAGVAEKMFWHFDYPSMSDTMTQSTLESFSHPYPENLTDTLAQYLVRLTAWGPYGECPSIREKIITVKPGTNAQFIEDTTIGCNPLTVNFSNLSQGYIPSTGYFWRFGDGTFSWDCNTSKTFINNSYLKDSTFRVSLIVSSIYDCQDTAYQDITVHPRIEILMTNETSASCTPLDIELDPGSSKGVDTFYWHVISPYTDTVYSTVLSSPVSIFHRDTTFLSPDTVRINLMGMNRMGCSKEFPPVTIPVYPEVIANFNINRDTICHGDTIIFINNSRGYELFNYWDFDDGTFSQDTTDRSYAHPYLNDSDTSRVLTVNLRTVSKFFCEDSYDTAIVVHPYVNASFGMTFLNHCTPVDALFTNASYNADLYYWDFGDSTFSNTAATNFTHQYWNIHPNIDTTYIVKLYASNNEGCTDSALQTLKVFPHIVADFSISDSAGCSPLLVHFTDSSSGGDIQYLWNFGDGQSSNMADPGSHLYRNDGNANDIFNVITLKVSRGQCDSTVTDTVWVFAEINGSIIIPDADSCAPFKIMPEAITTEGAHHWYWELRSADSTLIETDTNRVPDFDRFENATAAAQKYYLSMTAFGANDPAHLECAIRDVDSITIYPQLLTDFSLNRDTFMCEPYIATAINNTVYPPGTSFYWYLDGDYKSNSSDSYALNIPNETSNVVQHEIMLTGRTVNPGGSSHTCRDTVRQIITAYPLVHADFMAFPTTICSGDSVQVHDESRGGLTSHVWNWGSGDDNRSDTTFYLPFDNYSSMPVIVTISLTVDNGFGCAEDTFRMVTVNPKVTADFTANPPTLCSPTPAMFNNASTNATTYYWDFGDGYFFNTGSTSPFTHQYDSTKSDSVYTVSLLAKAGSCFDTITKYVIVNSKPDVRFTFSELESCPPFEVSMTNLSTGTEPMSFLWQVDGSTIDDERNTEYTFYNSGTQVLTKEVTLQATSAQGCINSSTQSLRVYPDVSVDIQAEPLTGCSPLDVDLNGISNTGVTFLWYYNDTIPFNNHANAEYTFRNSGHETKTYEIRFKAWSSYQCFRDTTVSITVFATPETEFIPDPVMSAYNTETNQTEVTFNNRTQLREYWDFYWEFGDNSTGESKDAEFTHLYPDHFWGPASTGGAIPVKLAAFNTENSACGDTMEYLIYIKAPLPKVALEDDIEGCVPLTIDFSADVDYVYPDSYEWDFGVPGATSTETSPTYTYTQDGTYTVQLEMEGDGGMNQDYRIIKVHPKPDIDFNFNDSIVFVRSQTHPNEIISFYNHTAYGESYYWGFALPEMDYSLIPGYTDTASIGYSTEKNPVAYYDRTGVYYVFLIAESGDGCYDTLIHPIAIQVLGEGRLRFPNAFFLDPASGPRDEFVSDPADPSLNIFRAYGEGVDVFKMEIYNRWGVLVYTSNHILQGWNGFIDGLPAKQDVYVWRAKGRFTNGESFEKSGDVTLIYGTP